MSGIHNTGIAVVLVTHNGQRFLSEQLRSIENQTVRPDAVFWVDDGSTDESCDVVRKSFANSGIQLFELEVPARSGDLFTRIAGNFGAALSAAADYPYIALCDQDDVWKPRRLERQRARLDEGALMTIADSHLIDESGGRTGVTMRECFPIPVGWGTWSTTERLEAVLRQPMATGAASMISNSLVDAALPIPRGWLHDRWLSLVAAALGELDVDARQLLDYRVYDAQAVGVARPVSRTGWRRIRAATAAPYLSTRKLLDLRLRLRRIALKAHRPTLRTPEIVRIYLTASESEATSCPSSDPTGAAYRRIPVGSAAASWSGSE